MTTNTRIIFLKTFNSLKISELVVEKKYDHEYTNFILNII